MQFVNEVQNTSEDRFISQIIRKMHCIKCLLGYSILPAGVAVRVLVNIWVSVTQWFLI